jgi:hypothetical protein
MSRFIYINKVEKLTMSSPISPRSSTPPPTLKVGDAIIANPNGFKVVGENKQNNYLGNIIGFSGWGLTDNISLGKVDAENIIHRNVNGKDEYFKVTTAYKPMETTKTPINDWLKLDRAEQERRSQAYKVTQLTPVTQQADGSFAKVTNQPSRVFVAREASWGIFGIGAKKAELIKDEDTLKYVLGEEATGKNARIKTETGAVLTQAVNTTQKMAKQLNQDRDAALTDLALFAVGGKVLNKLTGKAVPAIIAEAEAKAVTKVVVEETTKQVAKRGSKYFRRATKRFNKNTSKNLFQQTKEFFGNLFKGKPSTSTEPVVSGSMRQVKARKKTNIKAQPQPTTLPPVKAGSVRKVKISNKFNKNTGKNFIQKTQEFFGNLFKGKPSTSTEPVVSGSMRQVKARKKTNIKAQPQLTTLPPVKSGSARKVKTQQNPIQQFTSWVGQLNKPQKAPKP